MTQALVVGGSNQISAFLIPQLLGAGASVTARSRGPRPTWIDPHPSLHWSTVPPDSTVAFDVVYYLAPLAEFARLVPAECRTARVVAFSSTSAVTKQQSSTPSERRQAAELAAAERSLAETVGAVGGDWIMLRPTLIYGAGLDRNLTRVARWVRPWRMFPLLGKATGARQPVHAEDLATTARAAARASVSNRTYDLAGGSTLAYREMIAQVFRSQDLQPRFVPVPRIGLRAAVRAMRLLPRWRDLTPAMFERQNQDLVFDDAPARRELGHAPRPFSPDADTWRRLDRRQGGGA